MMSIESLRISQSAHTMSESIRPAERHTLDRHASETEYSMSDRTQAQGKGQERKGSVQEVIEAIQNDMELMHNVGLSFSVHEGTGRTMVRVIDRDTEKLIREIPPENLLDLAEKMQEMIGLLFDKRV